MLVICNRSDMSASGSPLATPAVTASLIDNLFKSAEVRERSGTAAPLRRALLQLPAANNTDELFTTYAQAYRAALSESLMLFLHLSKSGGTALCELAKLNGCSREAAGQSTFSGNCANKFIFDGPWWMPNDVLRRLQPAGLRSFAERSFAVPHAFYQKRRECRARGLRASQSSGKPDAPATFFAVEGALPEGRRCPGILELLVLRDPVKRLASFGRELMRWGLLPQPYAACDHLLVGQPGKVRREACDEVKRRVCANISLMATVAPPVYDNQLTRALLGHAVYSLPVGGITRDHYLIARERLRSVDVMLVLSGGLDTALSDRLGWSTRGLQSMYRRQSVAKAAAGAATADTPPSPPPCALEGAAAAHARAFNHWDILLFEEAVTLEAADARFFARPAVRAALATPAMSKPAAAQGGRAVAVAAASGGRVGSAARCGHMAEATSGGPGSGPPSTSAAPAARPICIHKRWRHVCCWSVGSGDQIAMPRLPPPFGCVLPPAGALSSQPSVRLPTVAQKQHHAGCALSCRGYPVYGLEAAGTFCMCLTAEEAASATQISERECRPSCASSGRLHANVPSTGPALPCGGSEAVALFSTPRTVEALAAAAATTASPAMMKNAGDACAPMAEPCASATPSKRKAGVRALYVRGGSARAGATPTADGAAPKEAEHFVFLGCFEARALERRGLSSRPDARQPGWRRRGDDADPVVRCSRGCARHAYFAVGGARLVGGACVCGELPTITWRRDAEGIKGLHARALRTLT